MSKETGIVIDARFKYTWQIKIGDGYTVFCRLGKPPNRFHRLMYKILLGWRVEKI